MKNPYLRAFICIAIILATPLAVYDFALLVETYPQEMWVVGLTCIAITLTVFAFLILWDALSPKKY